MLRWSKLSNTVKNNFDNTEEIELTPFECFLRDESTDSLQKYLDCCAMNASRLKDKTVPVLDETDKGISRSVKVPILRWIT